ncbi:MAG TPA: amylo-alpha-1,6-glucosidase [Hyphomicrobiaceae bacterium]|nr:amylo-alpha-1,6-glucosidase [Hyphomicrobiaceae bacterium]
MPRPRPAQVAVAFEPVAVEAPFYIPATDAPARPRRNLKHNDTFAVFDSHGDIGASAGGEDGLFDCDTRYLSHLELLINGSRPLLLHSAINDNNLNYYVDLTNPDFFTDGRITLLKDTIHISRTIYLCEGSLRERIGLMNHGAEPVSFRLSLAFASDFADIFEVRGVRRSRRGQTWSEVLPPNGVNLSYRGLDSVVRQTTLHFEPAPTILQESFATYEVTLAPQEKRAVFVTAASRGRLPDPTTYFFRGLVALKRELKAATRHVASVETSNSLVNEILCRSMADLYMLRTTTPDGPYPYAGIPWYSTTFGRDGIITAMQMLWVDPAIAAGVLRRLARLQALKFDKQADAAPGKILHEMRAGEMAALGEVPFAQYYGTVDATPLFIMLAGQYLQRTGDLALIRQIWPAVERALAWLDGPADVDGDGFIEYARGAQTGLSNQGWKDSHDAVFHADGRLAEGPIALVEVQGYAYAAKLAASMCASAIGLGEHAARLVQEAEQLRRRFEAAFWLQDAGFYALALDGQKQPCRVRTSNAGQALSSGIVAPERAALVAAQLVGTDFYSGWGVRTVARGEARYNPMSYHNGSIWPHDNAMLAQGLARYGAKRSAIVIFDSLMRATSYLDHRRIPELYCGFARRPGRGPTLYPAACSPQAWAAAAPFSLIQSMLGLEFRPEAAEIRLNNPVVPALAGSITLRNVSLGNARADFTVHPSPGGGIALEVLRTQGDLRISLIVDTPAHAAEVRT